MKSTINYSATINEFISVLNEGGIVLYPSDTIYGLGCDALLQKSVEKIYEIKKRPVEKSFLILVGSLDVVKENFSLNAEEERVLVKNWPGSITCLLKPDNPKLKYLCGANGRVGVRWAKSAFLCSLFKKWSGLLISTSSNLSGTKYVHDNETQNKIWKKKVDLLVLQDPYECGIPSSIISYEEEKWQEYRKGQKSLQNLIL